MANDTDLVATALRRKGSKIYNQRQLVLMSKRSKLRFEVGFGRSKLDPAKCKMDATATGKLPTTSYPTNSLHFLHKTEKQRFDSSTKEPPAPEANAKLKIVIVGAGLGGLATSIALARCGQRVIVLEQAHRLMNEDSTDVHTPSNAARLLERWELVPFSQTRSSNPTT